MTTYADATDKTVDTFKQGARAASERMDHLLTLPSMDFVEPVERYFDYLTKAIELNRELATRWAELVTQMTGTLRDEALKAGHALEGQVEEFADKTGELARKGQDVVDEVADEAGNVVDEAVETTKDTAEKATGKAKELADDAVDRAEDVTDEATDTAEDLADDAAETTQKTTSRSRRK